MANHATSTSAKDAHPLSFAELCDLYWRTAAEADSCEEESRRASVLCRLNTQAFERVLECVPVDLDQMTAKAKIVAQWESGGADITLSECPAAHLWRNLAALANRLD